MPIRFIAAVTLTFAVASCANSDDGQPFADTTATTVDSSAPSADAAMGDENGTGGVVSDRSEVVFPLPPLEPNVVIDPLETATSSGLSRTEYVDAVEARIAPCMQERGWEYVSGAPFEPVDATPIQAGALAAYRRAYGWEIISRPSEDRPPVTPSDNLDYWRSLDETMGGDAQDRFFLDLQDGDDNCRDRATQVVNQEIGADPDLQEKFEAYIAANPGVLEDDNYLVDDADIAARLDEQEAGWAQCMTDAGFGRAADVVAVDDIVWEEYDKYPNGPSESELDRLLDLELRLASAHVTCSEIHTWPVYHYRQTLFVQDLVDKGVIAELNAARGR